MIISKRRIHLSLTDGTVLLFALSLVLAQAPFPCAANESQSASLESQPQAELSGQQVVHLLSIAEQQHEIVLLLIKQGRYGRVLPEMKKIFELNLPERFEERIAQSAGLIANLLVESKQYALAHDVLNEAFARMRSDRNKAPLLKIEAYVYKSEGKYQEAVAAFERAVAIEKRLIQP
jgi:tetratricopeptide (TPR) repeat protein